MVIAIVWPTPGSKGKTAVLLSLECFMSTVVRMVTLTFERYIKLEESLVSSTHSFAMEEHEAYGAAVLIALQGILALNAIQFKDLFSWAGSLLSSLILCDDIDVRNCLSQIYVQHVNPISANSK